ncbi:hypothetical protein [Cellulomonas sp. ATA003]|uniref:hypothetical protein n=1 Tax=Cellulomonas sp. ATA003 TaxID=3073064 RepID=UPI002873E78E|nr:hypothetical protein [Cellulomonas sp. ATA003]WNB84858.1 hypothetical protein REH70_14090 [Cellulomonas sp. ATA003]
MSALPQSFAPAPRTVPAPPGPSRSRTPASRLRVVRAPEHHRTRVPFVVLCIAILAGALLGALVLNTTMASAAYEKHEMEIELAQLARTEQSLQTQLEAQASPPQLAASARALGLVQAPPSAYLRLADGAVLGTPTPAGVGG